MQINVAEVDEAGKMTGENVTYAFHGGLRETGDSDDALNRLVLFCKMGGAGMEFSGRKVVV